MRALDEAERVRARWRAYIEEVHAFTGEFLSQDDRTYTETRDLMALLRSRWEQER